MTSERSKRRDFLSLIFISKSISKKLLVKKVAMILKKFHFEKIKGRQKNLELFSDLFVFLMRQPFCLNFQG